LTLRSVDAESSDKNTVKFPHYDLLYVKFLDLKTSDPIVPVTFIRINLILNSPGPPVSSTNKTDRHDITEILLKVALNTMKQTNKQTRKRMSRQTVTFLFLVI